MEIYFWEVIIGRDHDEICSWARPMTRFVHGLYQMSTRRNGSWSLSCSPPLARLKQPRPVRVSWTSQGQGLASHCQAWLGSGPCQGHASASEIQLVCNYNKTGPAEQSRGISKPGRTSVCWDRPEPGKAWNDQGHLWSGLGQLRPRIGHIL